MSEQSTHSWLIQQMYPDKSVPERDEGCDDCDDVKFCTMNPSECELLRPDSDSAFEARRDAYD